MSEELNNTEEISNPDEQETAAEKSSGDKPKRKRQITIKKILKTFGILTVVVAVFFVIALLLVKTGTTSAYVKSEFTAKLDRMGIRFESESFEISTFPIVLEIKNASYNNKSTGEKLLFVKDARISLSVLDVFAFQLSRDVKVDNTEIDGLELWINFDENGVSNFKDVGLVEEVTAVNVIFGSTAVSIQNSLINFGDVKRKISAEAKEFRVQIDPERSNDSAPFIFPFDISSKNSRFTYDESTVDSINIAAKGVANEQGAVIKSLEISTPIGQSVLSGNVTNWESPKYDLKIDSTIDLTQTSTIFPLGTSIRGIGNFAGTVSGEGENYKVEGEIFSESLAAANVRLKAIKVNATVDGDDSMYNANGKAVAEMLTFEDFRIDYPQLIGNIRGTGTDFRWIGELQAIAAKTPLGTITGLFIKDAVADFKEKKIGATLGNLSAGSFRSPDVDIEGIRSGNVRIANEKGITNVSAPNATAALVKTDDSKTRKVSVRNLKIRDSGGLTEISSDGATAESLETEDARIRNLKAGSMTIRDTKANTDIKTKSLTFDSLSSNGANFGKLSAADVNIKVAGNETKIYSNNLKIAKLETDAAILGSLNVAGVRLSIREGRIEGRTGDVDAGTFEITKSAVAEGGKLENVKIVKPVFVLEPSGRYRASADMSLGGGILGSVKLGAARASVVAENDQVVLKNLTAQVMDGSLNGNAVIALNSTRRSDLKVAFDNLELSKLLAVSVGSVAPIEGKTSGMIDLNFPGMNLKVASGTVTADFAANAGTEASELVPVNGKLGLRATEGLFDIDFANLFTNNSEFNANGRFDLNGKNSDLNLALKSSEASEIDRIVRVLGFLPEIEQRLDEYQAELAGNLTFDGKLSGDLRPVLFDIVSGIDSGTWEFVGNAFLDSLIMKKRNLGTLSTRISASPEEISFRDGKLVDVNGGSVAFEIGVPAIGANNISVKAVLNNVNTGNLLAALPVDTLLPEQFQDFQAKTSGSLDLRGLPDAMEGDANISSGAGTINGEPFDGFEAKAEFSGKSVNIKQFDGRFGEGTLSLTGSYQTDSKAFNFSLGGKDVNLSRARPFIPNSNSLPAFDGVVSIKGNASGTLSHPETFVIDFNGSGQNVSVDNRPVGEIEFVGKTENKRLNANVKINFEDQPQIIHAYLDFADENLPFRADTAFSDTELTPIIALVRPEAVKVSGRATGSVFVEGTLSFLNDKNVREYTTENLSGGAQFSQFALQIEDTPLVATNPISVKFDTKAVVIEEAQFSGGGSNVVVSGTKAFTDNGINNFAVDGKINLKVFNAASKNSFFSGLAEVSVRLTGVNKTSRLTGRADLENASAGIFVGAERLSFDRITGSLIFNSNQAQINNLSGFLGGGRISASGGALVEGLKLQQFRINVRGTNITAPLPPNFITTGDADGEISGYRQGNEINTLIRGTINAKRSVYTKDIDVADIVGGRSDSSLSAGSTSSATPFFGVPKLDIRIEGRDALVVRNNLADLTASVSLRVTGDTDFPQISGRITANSGTILFRNDRYEVQRGTLEFPPNTSIEPYINLQAETEIKGYQIIVSLVGNITDTDTLNATVRSNPGLPQPDVISLITTGSLANTGTGIPTLAQSGINTAAEILTDSFINNPASRATDKLFGLNRFELDPIISGQRLNPSARLTVGRQINKNLLVTYATNLSADQNQVLAVEYRVSNKISFVAQYEQRSLSNVTQRNNNFSFEVRLRKRF